MRIVYTFVRFLALIPIFIECSSENHRNHDRERNPGPLSPSTNLFLLAECCSQIDQNPYSENTPGPSASSPGKQISPERTHSEEATVRVRSRSPPSTPSPIKLLGHSLRELGYIRLTPHTNPNIRFEFRRYVFPDSMPIRLRVEQGKYTPVPAREHIVLSTYNGDVFAILEYGGRLRGIYSTYRSHPRMKINMISSEIGKMTSDEIRDCPSSRTYLIIPDGLIESFADEDSLQSVWNPSRNSPPRARPRSPPGRPPSEEVLGYSLKELGYIRLIPQANPNQRFEFRRYYFPAIKEIRILYDHNLLHVPNREHIVLSTSNGEVFAILEYSGTLRGIYRLTKKHPRVKINMLSGAVDDLSALEMKECHVGGKYPIFPRWFYKDVTNEDSLQHVYH